MDDYITASGVCMQFDDQYVTTRADKNSKYVLQAKNERFYIFDGKRTTDAYVIIPPKYMEDKIVIGGKTITNYVNTYQDTRSIQCYWKRLV